MSANWNVLREEHEIAYLRGELVFLETHEQGKGFAPVVRESCPWVEKWLGLPQPKVDLGLMRPANRSCASIERAGASYSFHT
jgi:hypothetical protein